MTTATASTATVRTSAVTGPVIFREQSLQEVLEISFGVLKSHYLDAMAQQLQSASCWQSAEAALFGIR